MVSPGEVARSLGSIALTAGRRHGPLKWAAKVGLAGFFFILRNGHSFWNFFCMLG